MIKLRKPTEMMRATVQQEARVIVAPEAGGRGYRRVQILVPDGESLPLIGIDQQPLNVGLARSYKLSQFPQGQVVSFSILPAQFVIAASLKANLQLSVIVEYYETDGA